MWKVDKSSDVLQSEDKKFYIVTFEILNEMMETSDNFLRIN